MRIVFVNRIAWPDEGATALYLTDVAEACANAGHETHVVCGEAPYRTTKGMSARPPAMHGGVIYHRVSGRRGQGTFDRMLAASAFLIRIARRLAQLPKPDVVVSLTDPPFVDVVVGAFARRRACRTAVWVMDVYPDVAVAAGLFQHGSLLERFLSGVMGWSLRRAAAVIVLGAAMRRPILSRGVSRRKLRIIENWAPAQVEATARRPATPRPERPLTIMYSGNYGVAHDLGPLLERIRALPTHAAVRLILQVTGSRVSELRSALANVPIAVEWRDPVPLDGLSSALLDGDIHVVCVREGFEHLVVPSKIYAPLALGLPLLIIGPDGAAPGRLVRAMARDHPPIRIANSGSEIAFVIDGFAHLVPRAAVLRREQAIAAWIRCLESLATSRRKRP